MQLQRRRQIPRQGQSRLPRTGVSLLELMLVIGLLSVIAAISFPAMRRNMGRADVTASARQLQQQLQRARLEAMESAEPFLFQPQFDSPLFFLGPLRVFQQPGFELDLTLSDFDDDRGDPTDSVTGVYQLPVPMRFAPPQRTSMIDAAAFDTSSTMKANSQLDSLTVAEDQNSDSEDFFADVILFQPNGRIQSAIITIASEDGYRITIEIEGLAGRINVGQVTRESFDNFENRNERGRLPAADGVIE